MPQTSYPGRKNKGIPPYYFETRVQFADIYNHPKLKLIEKSPSQRVIDEDKVESMIDEYIKRPHFFRFKNHIVICDLRNKWYLVDGQHRIEMARRGYEEYNLNDEFIFCWYKCSNENDMRELFNSLNQDSIGNEYYVSQDHLTQIKLEELVSLLKINYEGLFSKGRTNDSTYTLMEFRDELIQRKFIDIHSTAQEILNSLREKNDEFFEINRYQIGLDRGDIGTYYKSDHSKLMAKFIVFSKHCNFLQWLENPALEEPYHHKKKEKSPLTPKQKENLWKSEYGLLISHECPITLCQNMMINGKKHGWHAGHIISERHGGPKEINNFKPICGPCNQSMGSKDWRDYDPCSLSENV